MTVQLTATSGIIATAKVVHTMVVMRRSVALRRPSTALAQAGMPSTKKTQPSTTQPATGHSMNSEIRPDRPHATAAASGTAIAGSCGLVSGTCEERSLEGSVWNGSWVS